MGAEHEIWAEDSLQETASSEEILTSAEMELSLLQASGMAAEQVEDLFDLP